MNLAAILKQEISRIARKEQKANLEALQKASTAHRAQIAALRRSIAELESQIKKLKKSTSAHAVTAADTDEKSIRFSAARLKAQRDKLGISAADMGRLIGVSALSVYKWESGAVRPREAQIKAIAAARGLGRREAAAKLALLGG